MGKWYTKKEKIKIIKYYHKNGYMNTIKKFTIAKETLSRWIKITNEDNLISGKGLQSKRIRRPGRPKTIDFNSMSKEELIKYIEMIQDIKKYLTKSKKMKFWAVWSLKKKYTIKYLTHILNISKSGYYKWFNNGMQKFNKWDSKLTKLIKISFLKFNKIYGYKMLTLIINKIYNLSLKAHMVYRYMKYLNLKSVQRIKKFKYKLLSGPFRYENLLSQNFRTTET
ncbi:hypothetical protein [Spiroplasma sp. ChiS]|uniref:hypothetical protein n=1 Tax=Spiroplasma sp. ChiS TaxID=2099885 RepID=UPI001F2C1CE5|nr:hypothetical protein [Spiroplasma sp. ChiS]